MLALLLALLACTPKPADSGAGASDDTAAATDPVDLGLDPACSPFAMADDCLTPWPNMNTTAEDPGSSTGLRLNYSLDMFRSPDGELPLDPGILNPFDGVSAISPVLLNLGRDVDPAQLAGHGDEAQSLEWDYPLALVQVSTGQRVPLLTEMDEGNRDKDYPGRWALILRPLQPLEPGERYVVGVTTALRDADGAPFDPPPAFLALRDGVPTTDERVEGMRTRYEDTLFPALETAGLRREDLLVAWEYQVASRDQALGPILSMKEQAQADMDANGIPFTVDSVEVDPNDQVAFIVEGTFQPPTFLIDNTLVMSDDNYSAVLQSDRPSYPFTLVVPKGLPTDASVPLVVMGHGIFGSGHDYTTGGGVGAIVQDMAWQAGVVVVATDWIGLSNGDLDLILTEVVPDIARVRVVTDRLAQSLINNIALVDLTRSQLQYLPDLGRSEGVPLIDPDRLYYYGVSLGGVQGSSLISLDDEFTRAVVSVPGASWTNMIQRSWHFGEIDTLLDLLYPDPLTQLVFVTALQSWFDLSDPVNLGRMLAERPGSATVLMQEAIGDCQVPNLATDILVRALGASNLDTSVVPIFGVPTVTGPVQGQVVLTQILLPDAVSAYSPPDENIIPPQNNDVHSNAVTTDTALGQVLELVENGDAVHPCSGPCDPD